MKQIFQELYTFWKIIQHSDHISPATFHWDLCWECVQVKVQDGRWCSYTMFRLQLTTQNISEVHLEIQLCEFICWVNFMNLQSPDNKFVEILEYFHNTVLQASCWVVISSWSFCETGIISNVSCQDCHPSILLSRNLCFSKHLGRSVEVPMMLMGNFEISTKLNSICYFSHFLKYKVKWVKWER